MNENNIITCEIVGFQEYGVFVRCDEYDGLVHISEISDQYVENIEDIFEVGDLVKLLVLDVNEEDKKLKLSYKKCHKIHKRILKNVKITKGFHKLSTELPKWIEYKKQEYNNEDI